VRRLFYQQQFLLKGASNMALEQNIRQIGDVTILDLSGRLSLGEALAFGPGSGVVLGQAIRELTKNGKMKILLNLAAVTYVDSSGLGQLTGALMSARNQGAELKLLKPSNHVLNLLQITKLTHVFDVQQDEAGAIQSFSKRGAEAKTA
jgi:anti-sigma B factor antagonist